MEEARAIVVGNKIYRPLLDHTVTDEDWKKAEDELNETPETRASALTALKKLLAEQADFISRTDDSFLLKFLRARKFDVERSFKLMKNLYTMIAKRPELFPSPSSVEKALKANIFSFLPHRDSMGRAIHVSKIDPWKPNEIPFIDTIAAGQLLSEYVLRYPATQINGYVGLWDFKGMSLKHFMSMCSPKNIFLLSTLLQDCYPGRFKVAYCVNCPPLTHTLWNICKVFAKEKFRKRVKILSDIDALHQFLDPNILPEEYGGVMPPSDSKEMAELVLKNEQYFNNSQKFGYKPR